MRTFLTQGRFEKENEKTHYVGKKARGKETNWGGGDQFIAAAAEYVSDCRPLVDQICPECAYSRKKGSKATAKNR